MPGDSFTRFGRIHFFHLQDSACKLLKKIVKFSFLPDNQSWSYLLVFNFLVSRTPLITVHCTEGLSWVNIRLLLVLLLTRRFLVFLIVKQLKWPVEITYYSFRDRLVNHLQDDKSLLVATIITM